MLLNPESLAEGLQGMQEQTIRSNKALFDRLDIIEKRTAETEKQMEKLLDLYLSDGFPKELLQERKGRLDETLANLRREQIDISAHLQTQVLSDEQIADIEAFCEQIRHGLEIATFEQRRQVIDLLNVRGTLAIEDEEKVVYVKCLLGQQLLSVARILPLSNCHGQNTITLTAWIVIDKWQNQGDRTSLAEMLFTQTNLAQVEL